MTWAWAVNITPDTPDDNRAQTEARLARQGKQQHEEHQEISGDTNDLLTPVTAMYHRSIAYFRH